jgi:membrane dipeptidase
MNAAEILKSTPVVDAHFDLLADVLYLRCQGQKRVIADKFLPGLKTGNVKVVVAALFIETLFVPHQATELALEQIDGLHQEMSETPGLFCLCTNYAEIEAAIARGEIAILLSLEGAEPIGTNLALLHTFHRLGVRFLGPAWGRRNAACEGSTLVGEPNPSAGGLSNFGKELIQEAERLGMLLDLSHLNDLGVQDLANLTRSVLFASHSNTRLLNPMERNVSDDIIRLIASRGGVIGVNAVNTICAGDEEDASPEMLVRHMEQIRDVAGIRHIGLGLDFFGGMNLFAPVLHPQKMKRPIRDVIRGHAALPELVTVMQQRGWTLEAIQAVLGKNFLRMYRDNLR